MPATREQIADTFQRHVERFGYGRASVEQVAAELGISKRTVYQHFNSKRDLYAFVVGRIAGEQETLLRARIADEPTARARMQRFLRLVISGMRAHIQATSKADWMQEFEIAYDAMAGAYGAIGTEVVAEGLATGEFTFDDPRLANELIGAMVTHYGVMVRDDREYNADEQVVMAIMRMLGEGCDRQD
ncbi:MAG: TetR/AcrR family transcriptional regulator [Actinomycetota bacterium]|nr:TetR/AcrR family transcriptional regulator [Actinomycetota bacterium]MDZ4179605.1 TetR/AcrR family transcriptional regulator [Coriobacteriia bacterium]